MRVLVAEDDQKIAAFIVNGLKQAGFAVNHAADGENGLHMATTQSYDAAVIDLMLPKLDGLSLIDGVDSGVQDARYHPERQAVGGRARQGLQVGATIT